MKNGQERQARTMGGQAPLSPKMVEDGGISAKSIEGIKGDINRGAAKFWAKRGMIDPGHERGYNYGSKAGEPKKTG